jgi:hypothetical protein
MPVDANVDGIHTGIHLDRDCEMALAEECKDGIDGVFPLPGGATMNEGQQQQEVCETKTTCRIVQRGMSPCVRASFRF